MNNWIAKNIFYRGMQILRGEPVFRKLEILNETQGLSLSQIKARQFEKLKKILICAYSNTSFYRSRFDQCGFNPFNLNDTEQLKKIPYLTKKEIQINSDECLNKAFKGRFSIESTSGSSGTPFKFHVSRNFAAGFRAAIYREHAWNGIDVGEKEARFFGFPMDLKSAVKEGLKDFLMNRKRFSVFHLDDLSMSLYLKKLNQYKPQYLYGYTSSLFRFSEFIQRKKLDIVFHLKGIFTTSEVLHESERAVMEQVWGCRVIDEYGSSETGIIAHECPQGGMHLVMENNFVEIVKDGHSALPGTFGEFIITNLDNEKMPLIRYRIGDVGTFSEKTCPCGHALPLIGPVEGRMNNMVLTPSGKVASGLVFYYIARSLLENEASINQFKIMQKAIDHIHFLIVKGPDFKDRDLTLLEKRVIEYLGNEMNTTFEFLNDIPNQASGKTFHFISELQLDIAGSQTA